MPAAPLTLCEREEIRAGIERCEPLSVIAQGLGRHRCTISAEVNRNGGRHAYTASGAQARADSQRARPKTPLLAGDPDLAAHVSERLAAKDSPMTISVELARGVHRITARVSHETIYTAAYAPAEHGLERDCWKGLHRRRRRRKPRHQADPGPGPLGNYRPLSDRPPAAENRSEVGHLEGDLIVGSYNRSAIITVFDRASRHLWLADFIDDHGADATLAALVELLERIPEPLRRTLTWDQGREIARWADLETFTGIATYICDPHSPWQRPTNENGNGLIRRWLPKSTDLSVHTPADLRAIEHRINTIPRRTLNWQTAHDVYHQTVAMTV